MDTTAPPDLLALQGRLARPAILEDEEIRARRQTPARVDRLDILAQVGQLDILEQVGQLDILEQVDRLDTLARVDRLDSLAQADRLAVPDPQDNLELIPMYSDRLAGPALPE